MRILQICARIPFPVEDGGSVYVFNTTKYLSLSGHDVHLASFQSELHRQDPGGIQKYCTLYYQDGRFQPYSTRSVFRSTFSRSPISIQHRMSKPIMKNILEMVPDDFDLVIFEGLHTASFLPLVRKKLPGTPVILRHVNVEFALLSQNAKNEPNFLKKAFLFDQSRLMKRFELDVLNSVDALTFISDKDASHLLPYISDPKPYLISPPGANTDNYIDFTSRRDDTLIAFSNWKWTPNLDGITWFFDHIWSSLLDIKPNLKLILAGNDLPKKISSTLPKNVTYSGFVDDLIEFNSKGTIQIVPLKSGSGVKLKVIEGLSIGNPIVSTSFGVDGIDLEDGVHFELANTPREFINKIISLLDDKRRRQELGSNAKELMNSNYSWDFQTSKLDEFLRSVSESAK